MNKKFLLYLIVCISILTMSCNTQAQELQWNGTVLGFESSQKDYWAI